MPSDDAVPAGGAASGGDPGRVVIRPMTAADGELARQATHANMNWRGGEAFTFRRIDEAPEFRHYCALAPARGDFGFVAEIDGRAAGLVWLLFLDAGDPGYGYIADGVPELSLCVRSGYRGAGLGERLLRVAIDEAAVRGIARVSLSVEAENEAAVRLYERVGFRRAPAAADAGAYVVDTAPRASAPGGE